MLALSHRQADNLDTLASPCQYHIFATGTPVPYFLITLISYSLERRHLVLLSPQFFKEIVCLFIELIT